MKHIDNKIELILSKIYKILLNKKILPSLSRENYYPFWDSKEIEEWGTKQRYIEEIEKEYHDSFFNNRQDESSYQAIAYYCGNWSVKINSYLRGNSNDSIVEDNIKKHIKILGNYIRIDLNQVVILLGLFYINFTPFGFDLYQKFSVDCY